MKNLETVLVLDFGGQYKEHIAKEVRQRGVYSIVEPCSISIEKIKEINPIGIILTGGVSSVLNEDAPKVDKEIFSLNVPILGICYGMQYLAYEFGGKVNSSDTVYGQVETSIKGESELLNDLSKKETVFMSYSNIVEEVPKGFVCTSSTKNLKCASFECSEKKIYGVQFHPQDNRSINGLKVIENFVKNICKAKCDYSLDDFIESQIQAIREQVGNKKVLLGLSGGVDSSVVAALISKAVPNQLLCVYVDHGFMRKNETQEIKEAFKDMPLTLKIIDAEAHFLKKLKAVTEPEKKRKIIGKEFVETFAKVAKSAGDYELLAQGTIYPDVIESGKDNSANIKSHHNVGGLPKNMSFTGLVEPLRMLFKDEVRIVGKKLGLPDALVTRQPFPGPGIAVRTIGELKKEKLDILRDADYIFREEMKNSGIKCAQYFAILTNVMSVGIIGDKRNYGYVITLRAVNTADFMTAECVKLDYDFLTRVSTRIVNEVKGVSRVCYDITGKPPATIEWE